MAVIDGLDPSGTTSLQRDIMDGKPTELDAWNGAVTRLAREVGVATPLHDFIYLGLLRRSYAPEVRFHSSRNRPSAVSKNKPARTVEPLLPTLARV